MPTNTTKQKPLNTKTTTKKENKTMTNTHKKQFWTLTRRRWLYTTTAATLPLLTAYNIINPQHAQLWLNLTATILAVTGSTIALANTTPQQTPPHKHRNKLKHAPHN